MMPPVLLSDERFLTETDSFGTTPGILAPILQLLFNTLQVGLAILDDTGTLIGHNAAWSRLIVSSLPDTAAFAHGSNVVEACLRASESAPFDSLAIASGLEAILRRVSPEFQIEYSIGCGPSAATFEIRGYPCEQASKMWVLLSHDEITARKSAERAAVEAAELLRNANIELEALNGRLQRLASVDELTNLLNRRSFEQRLATAWEMSRMKGWPLSLVFFDVDCFKQYNDTCGHPAGDICLQTISRILATAISGTDLVAARYGGEEFAVILPGWGLDQSWEFAQSFRQQIDSLALPHPASPTASHVTVSGGVAARISSGDSPREIVHRADSALYAAKRGGRNRICRFPED